jgi:hypothetical protein
LSVSKPINDDTYLNICLILFLLFIIIDIITIVMTIPCLTDDPEKLPLLPNVKELYDDADL